MTSKSYFRPAVPQTVIRTLINAGKGSALDFFNGLPTLIWKNLLKRDLRLLLNRPTAGSKDVIC